MKHNAMIIEVLVGLTLLAILFLAVRSFLFAKDEPDLGSSSMADIEQSLKKILEKANQVPSIAAAGAGEDFAAGSGASGGGESSSLLAEITRLKTDLESKQKQIEEMSAAASAAPAAANGQAEASSGPSISADEREKLEAQIKELQAKLSEYEIISEDIADLSFYKEQNARLQKELADVKGGAASTQTAATPEPSSPPPAVEEKGELVPGLAEALAAASELAASPPAEPEPQVQAPPVEPVAAPAEPAVENTVDADLMAEFEAAVEKQQKSATDETDLGALNMEKMVAEAAQIKTDVPDLKPEDVLNQQLDENKLLQEANAMKAGDSEDKKLMGQFENFVKKGE